MSGVMVIPDRDASGNILQPYMHPFASTDGLRFRGTGFKGVITAGTEGCIEYCMPELRYMNGTELILQNHEWDDTVKLQVIDKDGVGVTLGWYDQATWDAMPKPYVADEFGTDWNIATDVQRQGPNILKYPALIAPGLYVRICYNSTGSTDVKIKVNLFLHKKP